MKVLIPLPSYGFDVSESAIPWKYIKEAQHHITFTTPDGKPGEADEKLLTGKSFGLLKWTLAATSDTVKLYREMEASDEFQNPIPYSKVKSEEYDALVVPGGHEKRMRQLIESDTMQKVVVQFFEANKPVAAICHGCLFLGRSTSPKTGKSVLYGRKSSGLTVGLERVAYNLTRLWLGDYYLTYPEIYMANELKTYLADPSDFQTGPGCPIPLIRDTKENPNGWAFREGNYVSARWPGDSHRFAVETVKLLADFDK